MNSLLWACMSVNAHVCIWDEHEYICICMSSLLWACMCTHMRVHESHMCEYTHAHVSAHFCVHESVYVHEHTCTCEHMHVGCMCVHARVCT